MTPSEQPSPRIVFMGTPDFAVPALEAVHREFGVVAVVTVPDKPQGRGLQMRASAVKDAAISLGIATILQPVSLKDPDFVRQLGELRPDILCVIAFRILPEAVYSLASVGAFNVHASLLPRYRGAAPINHAIINGDAETGVTSFLLNRVVDTGSILLQHHWPIADGTTAGELYEQLKPLAAHCAVETCSGLLSGSLYGTVQDDHHATAAPKVFRETSRVNWTWPASVVRQWILGHAPQPGAWTMWNGEPLKILRASVVPTTTMNAPATYTLSGTEFLVQCGQGTLRIDELQLPGKKRTSAADFLRGYRGADHGSFE